MEKSGYLHAQLVGFLEASEVDVNRMGSWSAPARLFLYSFIEPNFLYPPRLPVTLRSFSSFLDITSVLLVRLLLTC